MFSQATTDQIFAKNGVHITVEDIEPHLQVGTNIHFRPTKLICLESELSLAQPSRTELTSRHFVRDDIPAVRGPADRRARPET